MHHYAKKLPRVRSHQKFYKNVKYSELNFLSFDIFSRLVSWSEWGREGVYLNKFYVSFRSNKTYLVSFQPQLRKKLFVCQVKSLILRHHVCVLYTLKVFINFQTRESNVAKFQCTSKRIIIFLSELELSLVCGSVWFSRITMFHGISSYCVELEQRRRDIVDSTTTICFFL